MRNFSNKLFSVRSLCYNAQIYTVNIILTPAELHTLNKNKPGKRKDFLENIKGPSIPELG